CHNLTSPSFRTGPNTGDGWMRITISDQPVNDDFPWAGSTTMGSQSLTNGETEDYPVIIGAPILCTSWEDWGDAPEDSPAYPGGILGRFPTCASFAPPGTREIACSAISTVPGATGYVRHLSGPTEPKKFWLGCGTGAAATPGVDSESDGKTNSSGGVNSFCTS